MINDKDTIHGKFLGALFIWLLHIVPIIISSSMEGDYESMISIKAVLKKDVSYKDLLGNKRSVGAGQIVDVYLVKMSSTFTTLEGESLSEPMNIFIAQKDADCFDIEASEFKTLD